MSLARSSIGVFLAQVGIAIIEFLGTLYVARAVGASILGTYALFVAVLTLSTLLTNMGVGEATIKRISEGIDQGEFLSASFLSTTILFLATSSLLLIFKDRLAIYIGSKEIIPFLFLALLLTTVLKSISACLRGEKKVVRAAALGLINTGGKVGVWLVLLTLGFGLLGLVTGLWIGVLPGIIAGFLLLSTRFKKPSKDHFKSLFSFSKYSWLGSIRGTAWVWTDTLVLGFFVASNLVGVYEVSWRITGVFFFVASAISGTLFPTVSDLASNGRTRDVEGLLEEALAYVGIIAIPGLIGAIALGAPVLKIFGEEFVIGYPILVILMLSRVFHGYEVTLAKTISALDRPDLMFKINLGLYCI